MTTQLAPIDWDRLELTQVSIPGSVGKTKDESVESIEPTDVAPVQDTKPPIDWGSIESGVQGGVQTELPKLPWEQDVDTEGMFEGSVKAVGKTAYHTGGALLGLANAPYAFVWGMMDAENLDPKEYAKMPYWQQMAASLGGGFVSAVESIAKPGSWGTQYRDYYKHVTGMTISQDLAHSLKIRGVKDSDKIAETVAPSLELLADLISDPTILLPAAAALAKMRVPKGFVREIPKHVMDQIEYLNKLDDFAVKEEAQRILRNAYDDKLWGIQSGETWQSVRPTATVRDKGRGGIVEGETFQNVKPGEPPTPPPTTPSFTPQQPTPMGQMGQVPREPVTVPEAARRIMEAAKVRKARYVAEGNLAKSSGISALGFLNKVRKRLGMPMYDDARAAGKEVDELYGTFASALMSRSFARKPAKEVEFFDLGALVQAAKDVFGQDDTLKALKVIAQEESEIGHTLSGAMPELEKTLGSRQFEEVGEQVGKQVKPPVAKVAVTTPPAPTPPTAPTPVAREVSGVTPEPGMRLATEEDIFDELKSAGVDVPRPEEVIVPGKTFKHIVPKKGENIPGVGEVLGMLETPDKKWWVKFIDDETGKARLRPLDEVMKRAQGSEVPPVTLDMMGFQGMFEDLSKRLRNLRVKQQLKTPFQKQLPEHLLTAPDAGKVVKKRRTTTYKGVKIFAPEIKKLEKDIIQNANELPEGVYRELFDNPIRNFEYAGEEFKELVYHPIKEAEHQVAVEWKQTYKWLQGLRKLISFDSRKRIGIYAIAQQKSRILDPKLKKYVPYNDGLERLKAMGITDIPTLTEAEMQVYKGVRAKLDEFFVRLNAARVASGHKPFPKVDNYFTFMHDFSAIEAKGLNPMVEGDATLGRFLHPTATPFKYAKPRGTKALPLETDAFVVMESYLPKAIRHIHMSPRIAKTRELLGLFEEVTSTGEKIKQGIYQTHPNLANFVDEWLLYQTGIESGSKIFHGKLAKVITALNKNMTFALLSWNLRTILIQPPAFRNTLTELGTKYMFQGLKDLFESATNRNLWKEPFEKSNVLLGRAYDVSVQQAMDAVRGTRFGIVKQIAGKTGMKPLQWFDIATAWSTWRSAYRKGIAEGLTDGKASRYADDVVVKTQASGTRSDIAKIQRTPEGKLVTLIQTFVINDFGYFLRDVLGKGNPRITKAEAFRKMLKYVAATTIISHIYEDGLHMPSPFGTPIRAALDAMDEGKEGWSVGKEVIKETLEGVPMIGGAVRYGSSPFGPVIQAGQEVFSTALSDRPPSPGRVVEWGGRIGGIPGTGQVAKAARRSAKGEGVWSMLAGKPEYEGPPPPARGTRGGRAESRGTRSRRGGR